MTAKQELYKALNHSLVFPAMQCQFIAEAIYAAAREAAREEIAALKRPETHADASAHIRQQLESLSKPP